MATRSKGPELEVFLNDMGTISIRRERPLAQDDALVVVDPDDVSALIRALDLARRQALRSDADEPEEVTRPAIIYPRRPVSSS
jgi:hypothetical protein